jgi:hypothetical protein
MFKVKFEKMADTLFSISMGGYEVWVGIGKRRLVRLRHGGVGLSEVHSVQRTR